MKKTALLATLAFVSVAHAYEAKLTKGQMPANISAMLAKASADTQITFDEEAFLLVEDRNLATSNFKMYVQTNSFIPVSQTAVRIWSDLKTGEMILGEMHLDEKSQKNAKKLEAKFERAQFSAKALKSNKLAVSVNDMVSAQIAKHDTDSTVISMKFSDLWVNGELVRRVEVRGRRGIHNVTVSLLKNEIIESSYTEFPQAETFHTLKANIFPIYEEVETTHEILPYEVRELKYIKSELPDGGANPLANLTTEYKENRYHPILAETQIGQMYNFWSEATIRRAINNLVTKLPVKSNSLSSGMLLQGKFTTIQIHPEAKAAFKNINFPLKNSPNHMINWVKVNGAYQAKPVSGLYGQPITGENDLLNRIPVRLADNDPTSYINNGADEAQVYYAVTTLMESLANMGFTDTQLSTDPFHAFLYDPDIGMKDNAYYTDNTINFTTYSPNQPNMARDNPTIWHELGHGVMDRLMGPHLTFGDTKGGYGGLSEGMADFVAKIIVEEQTGGAAFAGKDDFRIINETGFYLTNEYHDEGESYGGAMNDMLNEVIAVAGRDGLSAFTDLTLEAMRLTRNHPMLTARGWFEHMIYADELGSAVRQSGEFKAIIENALRSRNFSFDASFVPADMKVTFGTTELTNISEGSRDNVLSPCSPTGTVEYDLKVALVPGAADFIKFPATVKVEYQKGALQGAIKWEGEEANPTVYTVNSAADVLNIKLKASMKCETVNQPDGSCKDYAYLQVFSPGDLKPRAKKRFYLKLKETQTCKKI
jgi:hypothetical protein